MNEEEVREAEVLEEEQQEEQKETDQNSRAEEGRLFTQEELNKFVSERIKRVKAKYSDYEELKEKAAQFDRLSETSGTELLKVQEENVRLKEELKTIKAAEELRAIRTKIAQDNNLPIELLTEDTEEKLLKQAVNLTKYKENIAPGYPSVLDQEDHNMSYKRDSVEIFAEYMNSVF